MLQYTYQKSDTRAQSSPNLPTRQSWSIMTKLACEHAVLTTDTRRQDSNPRACQMLLIYGFFRV